MKDKPTDLHASVLALLRAQRFRHLRFQRRLNKLLNGAAVKILIPLQKRFDG